MRTLVLVGVLFVGLLATGIGLFILTGPSTPAVGRPIPESALPGGTAGSPPMVGLAANVDELVKALDLVRPARLAAAADFTVTLLDDRSFRLRDQRGKVVFINFWATWCPPCREEMPAMEKLWRKRKDGNFVMVAISLDADPAVVAPFVKKHGFTFPVALDPKQEAAGPYAVRALPSTFLIDRQGNLVALALGPRAWDGSASVALMDAMAR